MKKRNESPADSAMENRTFAVRRAPFSCTILPEPTKDIYDFYVLKREIGRGNFGVVRECISLATGQKFACKSIKKAALKKSTEIVEVRREVAIMQRLACHGHPNIVGLKAAFEDEDYVHLVMELCKGGELYDRIIVNKHLSEDESAHYFRQIAEATHFIHSQGILHRDLKPENILLFEKDATVSRRSKEGGASRSATVERRPAVKVADFGLAVFLKEGEEMSGCAGSKYYEAPELICNKSYGLKADSWSLGVILYAMLSGRLPFLESDRKVLIAAVKRGKVSFHEDPWPRVSEAAKRLVKKMLVVDPAKRASLAEVLADPWLTQHGGTGGNAVLRQASVQGAPHLASSPSPGSASPVLPSRPAGHSSASSTASPSRATTSPETSGSTATSISLKGSVPLSLPCKSHPDNSSVTSSASRPSLELSPAASFSFPCSGVTSPPSPSLSARTLPAVSPAQAQKFALEIEPMPEILLGRGRGGDARWQPVAAAQMTPPQPEAMESISNLTPHPPSEPRSRAPSPRRVAAEPSVSPSPSPSPYPSPRGSRVSPSPVQNASLTSVDHELEVGKKDSDSSSRRSRRRSSLFSICCGCSRPRSPTNGGSSRGTAVQPSHDEFSFASMTVVLDKLESGHPQKYSTVKSSSRCLQVRQAKVVPSFV